MGSSSLLIEIQLIEIQQVTQAMFEPLTSQWQVGDRFFNLNWSHETQPGFPTGCSVKAFQLQGGLSQGMQVVDVCTGAMTVRILPDRGMGLWKAWSGEQSLGWDSPVKNGPVHPSLVNQERRGGIGWLDGFDELLCRCGLASVGPPGKEEGGFPFTLHGRIANLPAWHLECTLDSSGTRQIHIKGIVDESALFDHQFRLTTTYTFTPGSGLIGIKDRVENLSAKTDHFQLLYHLNVGKPILGKGAQVFAPVLELSPQTKRAAEGIAHWTEYGAPEQGFAEQVYLMHLHGDRENRTAALLQSPDGSNGVAVRFGLDDLPCFTVWKNTGAETEGYVTGLEPATCFPNSKEFERQNGRLREVKPGSDWEAKWSIEWLKSPPAVDQVRKEISLLAAQGNSILHKKPHPPFTPQNPD